MDLKPIIKELAKEGVKIAEEKFFEPNQGIIKKEFVVEFIVGKIPLPKYLVIIKPLLIMILNKIIDEAIENAVAELNRFKKKLN